MNRREALSKLTTALGLAAAAPAFAEPLNLVRGITGNKGVDGPVFEVAGRKFQICFFPNDDRSHERGSQMEPGVIHEIGYWDRDPRAITLDYRRNYLFDDDRNGGRGLRFYQLGHEERDFVRRVAEAAMAAIELEPNHDMSAVTQYLKSFLDYDQYQDGINATYQRTPG